jgi:hypothetical protein
VPPIDFVLSKKACTAENVFTMAFSYAISSRPQIEPGEGNVATSYADVDEVKVCTLATAVLVQVNYRESITRVAPYDYTHKKQSGGSGQYGRVVGSIEPLPEGSDVKLDFVNVLSGTSIPGNFVPSIEKGFLEAMDSGQLTGHAVQVLCCRWSKHQMLCHVHIVMDAMSVLSPYKSASLCCILLFLKHSSMRLWYQVPPYPHGMSCV